MVEASACMYVWHIIIMRKQASIPGRGLNRCGNPLYAHTLLQTDFASWNDFLQFSQKSVRKKTAKSTKVKCNVQSNKAFIKLCTYPKFSQNLKMKGMLGHYLVGTISRETCYCTSACHLITFPIDFGFETSVQHQCSHGSE